MGKGSSGGSASTQQVSKLDPAQQQVAQALSDMLLGAGTQTDQINPAWTAWKAGQPDKSKGSGGMANMFGLPSSIDPIGNAIDNAFGLSKNVATGAGVGAEPPKYLTTYSGSKLTQTATPYNGQLVADTNAQMQQGQSLLTSYMNGSSPTILNDVNTALSNLMKGSTPQGAVDEYNKYMLPSEMQNYKDITAPAIKEAYVGPGTFWGSERAGAQVKGAEDFTNTQNKNIYDLINADKGVALNAANSGISLADYMDKTALSKAQAGITLGATQQAITQAGLDTQYKEFLRTTPEASPWLDRAMQLLGISTQDTVVTPNNSGSDVGSAIGAILSIVKMFCWVAAEIFGGWYTPRTCNARYYIMYGAPAWFRKFYFEHGKGIAKYIHDKPLLKAMLKPLFEYFAYRGKLMQSRNFRIRSYKLTGGI